MIYSETPSGGAVIAGCSSYIYLDRIHTIYGPGDVLYNIHKAKKGILEKVVIKKPLIRFGQDITGVYPHRVLYVDTLNAYWNETDLVTLSDAGDYAIAYHERLIAGLDEINCR